MNLSDADWKMIVHALNRFRIARETPMVDDDFPEMLHYADSALTQALKIVKKKKKKK